MNILIGGVICFVIFGIPILVIALIAWHLLVIIVETLCCIVWSCAKILFRVVIILPLQVIGILLGIYSPPPRKQPDKQKLVLVYSKNRRNNPIIPSVDQSPQKQPDKQRLTLVYSKSRCNTLVKSSADQC